MLLITSTEFNFIIDFPLKMEVAYIIGPYRSNIVEYGVKKNIDKAEEIALCLWKLGYAVICPHKNTAFFGGAAPDEVWMKGDLELLRRSDFAVTIKGWENSSGSREEVQFCRDNNIRLYHSNGTFNSLEDLLKDEDYLKKR